MLFGLGLLEFGDQLGLGTELLRRGHPTPLPLWSTATLLEAPEAIAELHADYAPRGFELVAVAMPHDRPDQVLELAEARALPFPVALDIDGAVLAAFEPVVGTPTTFLIDPDGLFQHRFEGPISAQDIVNEIERSRC